MDFLVLSRGIPGAGETDDPVLDEAHWSYMDRFAGDMIARGPTLTMDRGTWTGSLHVLALPGPDAALAFVSGEPYELAGMYDSHAVWGFENLLGRTMWDFPREPREPRFLVLVNDPSAAAWRPAAGFRDRLIVFGALTGADDGPAGIALAVQAPEREGATALLREMGLVPRWGPHTEIHDWEFGGRR